MRTEFFLAEITAQWDEGGGRTRIAGRTHKRRGGHAAADKVSLCWSSDINRNLLQIHTWLTICVLNSDLRVTVRNETVAQIEECLY